MNLKQCFDADLLMNKYLDNQTLSSSNVSGPMAATSTTCGSASQLRPGMFTLTH